MLKMYLYKMSYNHALPHCLKREMFALGSGFRFGKGQPYSVLAVPFSNLIKLQTCRFNICFPVE